MARPTKYNGNLTEEDRDTIKAKVAMGWDSNEIAEEYNIAPSTINKILQEEPTNVELAITELVKHRPEVVTKVLDALDIPDEDKDTIDAVVDKMSELDNVTQDAGLIIAHKLVQIASSIDAERDKGAYIQLASIVSTLSTLRNGFFKQGTVVQVSNTVNNNKLTMIKGGGRA